MPNWLIHILVFLCGMLSSIPLVVFITYFISVFEELGDKRDTRNKR